MHPDDLCATLPLALPRQPRLDAPEVLHHIMVRGLERCALILIFSVPPLSVHEAVHREKAPVESERLLRQSGKTSNGPRQRVGSIEKVKSTRHPRKQGMKGAGRHEEAKEVDTSWNVHGLDQGVRDHM